MPVYDMADLPAPYRPPVVDERLLDAARDIALIASGLLQSQDASVLTASIPGNAEHDRFAITLWDQRLRPCRDPRHARPDRLLLPAIATMDRALTVLFDRLAVTTGRPTHSVPPSCIVTDGAGVLLVVGDPPHDATALIALMARIGRSVAILPIAPDGILPLLTIANKRTRLN